MSLLARIQSPADVKNLASEQLPQLAQEIRERIIQTTSKNGGHVGPNLGVVELTIRLDPKFRKPKDRFCLDVPHQG
jgi:1-deoxy-D-xylulose-5-phosphate synthase